VIRVMQLTFHTRCQLITVSTATGPVESCDFSPRRHWFSIGVDHVGFVVDEVTLRQTLLRVLSMSLISSLSTSTPYIFMRHITTFRSTTDRIYDGSPIIL
jgi:hypothetical protein